MDDVVVEGTEPRTVVFAAGHGCNGWAVRVSASNTTATASSSSIDIAILVGVNEVCGVKGATRKMAN